MFGSKSRNDNDDKTSNEPGIISEELINRMVLEQRKIPKGIQDKNLPIKFDEVEEIRIEFCNILNIEHLWPLKNLVKLKLSSNMIQKIQNLETLVNLRELDLSFNYIEVMENVETLVNVEVLTLFHNKIKVIEGLDTMKKLKVFSIGDNKITTLDHILYLRNFKSLRSLNMSGNPCMQVDGYVKKVIALVPQLIYFGYRLILGCEHRAAQELHSATIESLLEKESNEEKQRLVDKAVEDLHALHFDSYVEFLDSDDLFQQMYKNDREGNLLLSINKDTQAAYEEFGRRFTALCLELHKRGLEEHLKRKTEIQLFDKVVNKAKEVGVKEAREAMDKLVEKKSGLAAELSKFMKNLRESNDVTVGEETSLFSELEREDRVTKTIHRLEEEYNDQVSKTWTSLMHRETVLHEQLQEAYQAFEVIMTDMIGVFFEATQNYFTQLRNIESEYVETLEELVNIYLNNLGEDGKIPKHLVEVIGDKGALVGSLAGSHDVHTQVIDQRQDTLTSRMKNWLENFIESRRALEKNRNEQHILEISHFLDFQREDFKSTILLPQHVDTGSITSAT